MKQIYLPCQPTAARVARCWLRHELSGPDARPTAASTLTDTVELLLTEVVTNAVIHAATLSTVWLRHSPTRVCVEVQDESPAPLETSAGPPEHPCDAVAAGVPEGEGAGHVTVNEGGRGLKLLDALAQEWGWKRIDGGKIVWFCVTHPPQDARA